MEGRENCAFFAHESDESQWSEINFSSRGSNKEVFELNKSQN